MHAGEFLFWKSDGIPHHSQEHIFQNHRLHFFFYWNEEDKRKANNEKKTIISDNIFICFDDFKLKENILKKLFMNLLDHHISFVNPQGTKSRSEDTSYDDNNMIRMRPAKKQIYSKKKAPKKWLIYMDLYCFRLSILNSVIYLITFTYLSHLV